MRCTLLVLYLKNNNNGSQSSTEKQLILDWLSEKWMTSGVTGQVFITLSSDDIPVMGQVFIKCLLMIYQSWGQVFIRLSFDSIPVLGQVFITLSSYEIPAMG